MPADVDPPADDRDLEFYLSPGQFIDSDSAPVQDFAARVVGDTADPRQRAARLFLAVRDGLRYDPYNISTDLADYQASAVCRAERAWCVPKAVLLTAAARAAGIPARIGFADVRNHLHTDRLRERMGGVDVFVYHGYSELWTGDRWVKATPAFNIELCRRFGVPALEFDGTSDALFHPYTADGRRHMEYIRDRGTFHDLPFEQVLGGLHEAYGPSIVAGAQVRDRFTA